MSNLQPYLVSLVAGLGIGGLYGLLSVRSPAPPIIALLGLLGMLVAASAGLAASVTTGTDLAAANGCDDRPCPPRTIERNP
ncbi:DUF1427 family protein [Paracoccus binzhouensis]|uniref:DUF1427 family protein n=1 Tax=Paracoccus binzhouensis TaxID=2796149 RepID=UPI0018EF102E|nr:DUF1427 family protein [Paracoccus binzhouensis]